MDPCVKPGVTAMDKATSASAPRIPVALAWFVVVAALLAPAQAQDGYPSRPITLVVPVPPGGASDFIARTVGQKLSDALGQPVVISNRGGASGTIASDNVAKSPPDGYTLLVSSITTHGVGPLINTNAPYDSLKDFTSVAFLADFPLVMTINAGHPMKSVAEVIAYAKANPGKLTFASSGNGGAPHLAGELFQIVTGTKMLHVPYRGSAPAVIDVGGGRVDIMFDGAASLLAMIQAGKVRPLATLGSARLPILADVPTFEEVGIKGVDVSLWFGMSGPAGMPAPVLQRLNTEIGKLLQMPDVKETFGRQGAVPMGGPPERYDAFIRAEQARWGDVVRRNNIRVD
jgi:tripartite-type tricarboxylate transporter receptor subunit TctC